METSSEVMEEPEVKRSKMEEDGDNEDEEMMVQFESENGEHPFPSFSVPLALGPDKLLILLRTLIKQKR